MRGTPAQRFFAKVDVPDPAGCWLWNAAVDRATGYGRFSDKPGRMGYAHRFAYEHFVGPIPTGYDIDHLCRVRHCVNPRHLEAVTRRENLMRGETLAAAHAAGRYCGFDACPSCESSGRKAAA